MKPTTRLDTVNYGRRSGKQFTLYLNPITVAKFDQISKRLRKDSRSSHIDELMAKTVQKTLSAQKKRRAA